jgi:hypothetical protein
LLFEEKVKEDPRYVWFSGAFNTGGIKQTWANSRGSGYRENMRDRENSEEKDIPIRMFLLTRWIQNQGSVQQIVDAGSQKESFDAIMKIPGFGGFLAYQVFVDLTYIPDFPYSENEFVVSGPGCTRGLKLLFTDFDGLSMEEAIFWLRDNQKSVFQGVDFEDLFWDLESYDRELNIMCIENLMCELSKLMKYVRGTGRPRNRYRIRKGFQKPLF